MGRTYVVAIGLMWVWCQSVQAAVNNDIRVMLEEPADGQVYASVNNVRGWALGPVPIVLVELYIDGDFHGYIPTGAVRRDVEQVFPGFPDSAFPGFSMVYNYGLLESGAHTFTVRAYDQNGDHRDSSSTFETAGFHDAFIAASGTPFGGVDISSAGFSASGSTLTINGMLVDDGDYDVDLSWRTAVQGFMMSRISLNHLTPPTCPDCVVLDVIHKRLCPSFIEMELEEPVGGLTYSSVDNIRGWAVATGGVKRIELIVDGAFVSNIPTGGRRDDVRRIYEDGCTEASGAGFSLAYFFAGLGPGSHEIEIHGVANTGATETIRSTFNVVSFRDARFLGADVSIDLATADIRALDQGSIEIDGAMMDGNPYRIVLQWNTAKQGFLIVDIDDLTAPITLPIDQ